MENQQLFVTLLAPIMLSFVGTAFAADEWGEKENSNLEAQEVYVEFYPVDGILMIREYGLSSLLTDEAEIQAQASKMQELTRNAEFCKKRFELEGYVVGQEKLIHTFNGEIHGVNTECILITANEMPVSMISAFSSILEREVEVTGNPREITLSFLASPSEMSFSNTNALRTTGDTQTEKVNVVWKNGERAYEILVRDKTRSLELFEEQSMYKYFPELPIMSPTLTPADIKQLRESLKQ